MTYKIAYYDEVYFVVKVDSDTAVSSWSTKALAEKEIERLTKETTNG